MSLEATLIPEFDFEMATTRKLIERVPSEKGSWKPHEKSYPLNRLAQHIAQIASWFPSVLRETELNLATVPSFSFDSTEALLDAFDKTVSDTRTVLQQSIDADRTAPWSLKYGQQVLFTIPRAAAARSTMQHLVHHRGQLSVYLRLLDIPVPAIYGPSADEQMQR